MGQDQKTEKLFDVEALEIEYTIEVRTFPYNKVFTKLLKLIKADGIFSAKEMPNEPEFKRYLISGKLKGTENEFIKKFRNDIISYLPDHFPENYSFDFSEKTPLGYVSSFIILGKYATSKTVHFSHKISEVRHDGTTKAKKQTINV